MFYIQEYIYYMSYDIPMISYATQNMKCMSVHIYILSVNIDNKI